MFNGIMLSLRSHASRLLALQAQHSTCAILNRRTCWTEKLQQIAEISGWLRGQLRELGLQIVAPDADASPAVLTIALPSAINSKTIGWQLKKAGYLLSYNSQYLLKRNWIQICLMGEWSRDHLATLPGVLASFCAQRRSRSTRLQLQTVSA